MLPFKQAIRFPILVEHNVILANCSGQFILNAPQKRIRIGFGNVGIFDKKNSRTILNVSGVIECDGKINIGHGSKLYVLGKLKLGNNFKITAESTIICKKEIVFGSDALISWDVLIMDTDHHQILDFTNEIINEPAKVVIGNHVWIGCRSSILKGVTVADNIVIAANSNVCKSASESNCIYAGNPIKVIRENVKWNY